MIQDSSTKMFALRAMTSTIAALLLLPALSCINCGTEPDNKKPPVDDGFADYKPDPKIFMREVNSARSVVLEGGVNAAVDQLLIVLKDNEGVETARELASSVGGELVGQIPQVGIYQLHFANSTDLTTLETVQQQLLVDTRVVEAAFNVAWPDWEETDDDALPLRQDLGVSGEDDEGEGGSAELSACTRPSDLDWISGANRAALEETGYYQWVPIMDALVELGLPLQRTTVLVVDTGLRQNCGEFDDVPVLNVAAPGTPLTDQGRGEHGTTVAGVIAADNDGSGVNGIAARVLPGALRLAVVPTSGYRYLGDELGLMVQALLGAEVRVVNMSYGPRVPTTAPWLQRVRNLYRWLCPHFPDVLFVAAAGNENAVVTSASDDPAAYNVPASEQPNYCPAGIQLDNLITVGATAFNSPAQRASFSNYGPRVDLAAPGEKVPCVHPSDAGKMKACYGTSFATPLVAASASVLFAVAPELSGAEAKRYLMENAAPSTLELNGARLRLWAAVGQRIVDAGASAAILDLIDRDADGDVDAAGLVALRLCGGFCYEVEGFGEVSIIGEGYGDEAEDVPEDLFAAGALLDGAWSVSSEAFETLFNFSCQSCAFDILHQPRAAIPAAVNVTYMPAASNGAIGNGTSGQVEFKLCEVLQRYNLTVPGFEGNAPSLVGIEGILAGQLELVPSGERRAFSGDFLLPFAVPLGSSTVLLDAIEQGCIGGLQTP